MSIVAKPRFISRPGKKLIALDGNIYKVPDGYTAIEYIQSDGTQSINSGFTGPSTSEYDIQIISDGTRRLMGYGGGSNEYWGVTDGKYEALGAGTSYAVGNRDMITFTYPAVGSTASVILNKSIVLSSQSASANVSNKYLRIFSHAGSTSMAVKAKLYSFKMIQNNEVVSLCAPMINSSGVAGLYDFVRNTFLTNEATSGNAFITGPEVAGFTLSKPAIVQRRIIDVPVGYKFLEYVQSTGATQLIDTGITGDTKSEYVISFVKGSRQVMGYSGSLNEYWGINGSIYEFGGTTLTSQNAKEKDTIVWDYKYNTNSTLTVTDTDGNSKTVTVTGRADVSSITLKLFQIPKFASLACKAKLYSFKVWKNDVLTANCVPAIRISDNAIGLYDYVSNSFMANSGTDPLIAGPVIDAIKDSLVMTKEEVED